MNKKEIIEKLEAIRDRSKKYIVNGNVKIFPTDITYLLAINRAMGLLGTKYEIQANNIDSHINALKNME